MGFQSHFNGKEHLIALVIRGVLFNLFILGCNGNDAKFSSQRRGVAVEPKQEDSNVAAGNATGVLVPKDKDKEDGKTEVVTPKANDDVVADSKNETTDDTKDTIVDQILPLIDVKPENLIDDIVNSVPKIISDPVKIYTAFAVPNSITLKATIRDFSVPNLINKAAVVPNPDFESSTGLTGDVVLNEVKSELDADNKPVYAFGAEYEMTHAPVVDAIASDESFRQWFRDYDGINKTIPYELVLTRDIAKNTFVVSKLMDAQNNGGFFPLDDVGGVITGFGNEGRNHNFHFTMEIASEFTYQGGEVFDFTGDDDVWVFINRKLVVDLGGLHPARSRSVNLDSLGLVVGKSYPFHLFYAERHTSQSNLKITTSMRLYDSTYHYQVVAADDDGDLLTYSLDQAPAGMSIDPKTGMISWDVPATLFGNLLSITVPVVVKVSDDKGASSTQDYSLSINKFSEGAN